MVFVNGNEGGGGRAAKRAHWRKHVRAWERSGLSAAGYCRREGLDPKRFYRWRRVFATCDAVETAKRVEKTAPGQAGSMLFAEVQITEGEPRVDGGMLEVVVAGERRIRVGVGFDESVLRRVVRVLEALPC